MVRNPLPARHTATLITQARKTPAGSPPARVSPRHDHPQCRPYAPLFITIGRSTSTIDNMPATTSAAAHIYHAMSNRPV